MSKIGMTLLKESWDSPLSPHFGKAKWVLVYDTESEQQHFERNRGLNGRAVVDIMAAHGCTDAIFTHIGAGALRHLREAGMAGWYGAAGVPASEVLARWQKGELQQARSASAHDSQRQHGQR